ncbi:MAG: hypothetical protein GX143_06525, partial [Alcaligenaceae bacterium]|nr:hypothetical protein [Alcaligenaceae bacterium]
MNRIYKSIFNEQTGTYVAVSENTKNKGKKGNKVLAATALSAALGLGAMGSAQAQLVDACAGVSLPRSVVTELVGKVVNPIYTPIETTVNGILGPVDGLVDLLGLGLLLPDPLNLNLSEILDNAANGDPITLGVLNADGSVVGPTDACDLTADSLNLTDPAGIAIGGNTITGLGSDAAGAAAVSSATDFTSIAVGNFSQATQSKAIAFGEAAQATGVGSLALGADAKSSALNATSLGTNARANAANSVALGAGSVATQADTISVGRAAGTDGVSDPGLTRRITNLAEGITLTDAVNLGQLNDAITNINTNGLVRQPNPSDNITVGQETQGVAVDFSGSTTTPSGVEAYDRKLIGVAAGDITKADSNEAVTGGQLYTTNKYIADALGGDAAVNLDGTLKAPEYELTYGTPGLTAGKHDNVGSVLGELAGHVGSNAVNIANNTNTINQLLGGAEGIVKYDDTDPLNPKITVGNDAKFDGATSVDFTANNGEVRKLTGLAAGELSGASTDAVTGAQLFTTNTNLGKTLGVLGASIDPTTGEFKDPEYKLDSNKTTEKTVGGALSNLDGRVTANTGLITNITGDIQSIINGETGIVKYDSANSTITVGSDGPAAGATTVNFAGKDATTGDAVNRKLTGIANGKVVENGNEAVTGGQLFTTNKAIESALGGKDASGNTALKMGTGVLDADGNLISPTYTLTAIDDKGGAADVDTTGVGGALYSLNTSMGNVNSIVNNLQTQLNSGTIGLVQQDGVTHNITVGANTNGTIVDFAGKDATTGNAINRTLSGVAAGTADTDAVNVSQLNAAVGLLGGGAEVKDDGTVKAPTYQLDDGKGNKVTVTGVENALTNLDGRVASNTTEITTIKGDISNIQTDITNITNGTAGIVKFDAAADKITVGSEVAGSSVDFTGKDSSGADVDRKLTGVAAGTKSNHAVNRQQLDSVAAALGGAKDANGNPTGVFNDEGDFTNPLYELNNVTNNGVSTTETTRVTGVGSALTHLNDSVVSLQNQVNSSIGLIQQPGTGDQTISIGGNTGGTVINIAGTDGDRQITGVAAGTAPNHAVNKQQLDNTAAALRGDIRRAEKRSEAGIAAATAVATLGQAYQPGQSAFSVGGGTWRGEAGYAVGLSTVSENGKWLLKGAVSGSGR